MPSDADIDDYYWSDLQVVVAREELFATRVGDIRTDGLDVYRDDGWGRIVRAKPGTYFTEPVPRILSKPSDLDNIQFDPPDLDMRCTSFLDRATCTLSLTLVCE